MALTAQTLPNDTEALKAMVLAAHQSAQEKQQRIELLEEQIRYLKHQRFAASRGRQAGIQVTSRLVDIDAQVKNDG